MAAPYIREQAQCPPLASSIDLSSKGIASSSFPKAAIAPHTQVRETGGIEISPPPAVLVNTVQHTQSLTILPGVGILISNDRPGEERKFSDLLKVSWEV